MRTERKGIKNEENPIIVDDVVVRQRIELERKCGVDENVSNLSMCFLGIRTYVNILFSLPPPPLALENSIYCPLNFNFICPSRRSLNALIRS